ncbi:MAG: acyltransferase family protein, partial [Bacteroidota bacterium]
MQGAPSNKIQYLEGLRGIAAFMVLSHHFMLAFYPGAYDGNPDRAHLGSWERYYYSSPINVLTNGNFCVTVFFVLSGFVLSRKYWQSNNFSVIMSAAKRRFFRLFIPVAFTLIISFILLRFSLYKHVEVSAISHSEWWLGTLWPAQGSLFGVFLEHVAYGVMFLGYHDYDTSMWTMSIELFGSFLVFGLLAVTHPIKRKY